MALAVSVGEQPREKSVEAPEVQAMDGDHGAVFQIVPELTNPPEIPVVEEQPEVWSPLDWLSEAIAGEQSPPTSPPARGNDIDAREEDGVNASLKDGMDTRVDVGIGNGTDTDSRVDATLEQWLSSVKSLFAVR
ncbi:hypothetical protein [Leptothoe sp. PORK10 BA2]|uniref:hypothetical protein n=1 Tax=Leptothoe sp. PORK10 BA2 TaxID=3110254 RepID=UPI002B205ABD|nr:hypothetical protein [Leptothoe sp. PORK10 BA2]MEA5463521.1 hypothetical protein [Leptothoe sp. PORK10 BA2]